MRYCLNPDCPEPNNPAPVKVCQACGSKLLLHDRYQALKALARGGFGATFIGVNLRSPQKQVCVIKQLRPATTSLEFMKMSRDLFDREARTLQKIGSHAQIPMLLDYFEAEGQFYLVQEYVKGWTIQQEIRRVGTLTEHGVKQFLVEILPVLQYVHNQHVIHRDIKPANIIRREEDKKLVLIDFGAVKTQVSQTAIMNSSENTALTSYAIGTPGYAPPEQMAMRPVYSSDIYALGVSCIYMLLGRPPKDWDYNPVTGDMLWKEQLRVSSKFLQVLEKMTEVKVSDRYKSADELLRVLQLEPYMDSLSQGLTSQPQKGSISQGFKVAPSKTPIATNRVQAQPSSSQRHPQQAPVTKIQAKTTPPQAPQRWNPVSIVAAYEAGHTDFVEQQLNGLNLQGVTLIKVSFHKAHLTKVNLQKANLTQADFGGASLNYANLREANLSRAYFSFADLEGADLRGANLSGAYFNNANLRGANLSGANLTGAKINPQQLALAKINWATTLPNGKRGMW